MTVRGYADRLEAGRQLAGSLRAYADRPDVIVLGLPRGGVPVAYAVAETLDVALDVYCVRKLGVPWHRELAMGAVAAGGVRVLNEDVLRRVRVNPDEVDAVVVEESAELVRREHAYRGDRPPLEIRGRVAILVDDGLATGATARAGLSAVRQLDPSRLVLAVPVAPREALAACAELADEVICPLTPDPFDAVGRWYDDFTPTTDDEVRDLLARRR
jgi:predicted phosphoribosyltransferase